MKLQELNPGNDVVVVSGNGMVIVYGGGGDCANRMNVDSTVTVRNDNRVMHRDRITASNVDRSCFMIPLPFSGLWQENITQEPY
jgi:hypothetical protein